MVYDPVRDRSRLYVGYVDDPDKTDNKAKNTSAGESIGYIGRMISSLENPGPYELGPFVLQSVLLLVSPALLAASIYMMLGRIILVLDADKLLFIRRTWLTQIFVAGDVICFLCQAGGAGLLSSGDLSMINTGDDIIVAGLFIQVVFFGLFVIAAGTFHYRLVQAPEKIPLASARPWRKHMFGLYAVSILIFVRSIVRCVEYIEGFVGYIITHEVFLYCFDALAMFFAVVAMNVAHPGEIAKYVKDAKAMRRQHGSQDSVAAREVQSKEQAS